MCQDGNHSCCQPKIFTPKNNLGSLDAFLFESGCCEPVISGCESFSKGCEAHIFQQLIKNIADIL